MKLRALPLVWELNFSFPPYKSNFCVQMQIHNFYYIYRLVCGLGEYKNWQFNNTSAPFFRHFIALAWFLRRTNAVDVEHYFHLIRPAFAIMSSGDVCTVPYLVALKFLERERRRIHKIKSARDARAIASNVYVCVFSGAELDFYCWLEYKPLRRESSGLRLCSTYSLFQWRSDIYLGRVCRQKYNPLLPPEISAEIFLWCADKLGPISLGGIV